MPLSISRKVFLTFLLLTLVTLALGTTINLSMKHIIRGEERVRAHASDG